MEIDFSFSPEEKTTLLGIARRSIEAVVSGRKFEPVTPEEPRLRQKAGAFVTIHLHGDLKGCIGLIEARLPLFVTVAEMAAKAAVADPRFERVTEDELQGIEIEISVLSEFKKIGSHDEVIVGKHGLMIENGYLRGLLLPQVATENRWDRRQFLEYVCVKAGLDREAYRDPRSTIYIFTAEVFGDARTKEQKEEDVAERK